MTEHLNGDKHNVISSRARLALENQDSKRPICNTTTRKECFLLTWSDGYLKSIVTKTTKDINALLECGINIF